MCRNEPLRSLTGGATIYRIKTEFLRDASLSDAQLGEKAENLGATPKPDGMLEGRDGTVYLAAFEEHAIVRFDAGSRKSTTAIEDDRLQWPDTLAWGPDDKLYVTTSQIHRMPKFHGEQSKWRGAFAVYRVKLPERQ